jgi:hypothetical protein
MPITPPPIASYAMIYKRSVKWLGIADPNHPEGDTIAPNAPYTDQMVKTQICQSDHETCAT